MADVCMVSLSARAGAVMLCWSRGGLSRMLWKDSAYAMGEQKGLLLRTAF